MKGQFGPTGALYDAWESRRHNPSFDWYVFAFTQLTETG
jgi:allantoicase